VILLSDFLSLIQSLKETTVAENHRKIICLQGMREWCFHKSIELCATYPDFFWLGDSPSSITSNLYHTILGQECRLLIINALEEFNANQFAASEGCLKGGGLLILLMPIDLNCRDRFYHYIKSALIANNTLIIQAGSDFPVMKESKTSVNTGGLNLRDQQQAVDAILKTVTGHRRRPLVLTANRGRGKSASLGLAARKLIDQGYNNILVCAPNKKATNTLFKHAQATGKIMPVFIALDALIETLPKCDLLIIDEAAAIPVPLLEVLVVHYSRIVFSSTLQGYEGSGRGFALRFQKRLAEITPQWRALKLNTPIRWAENDPVEQFTLSTLCLTEINALDPIYIQDQPLQFRKIEQTELLENSELLHEIFGLLVNAHYQTKPSDLQRLLNDDSLSIFTLSQNKHLLAVSLINREGELAPALAKEIYYGNRRIQGHLVPQSLTFHSGFELAATQKFARIQRIAVHPSLQNKGIGHYFIENLIKWGEKNQYDHLCASFSATHALLKFWLSLDFTPLRFALSKDKSSGTHSLIVNYPLSSAGNVLNKQIGTQFQDQLSHHLTRSLQKIDSKLVASILEERINTKVSTNSIENYLNGNLPYEYVEQHLQQLILNKPLIGLTGKQQEVCIEKILQNHSWESVAKKHGYSGNKAVRKVIKESIRYFLEIF